jgi:hypothetical protein
MAKFGAVFWGLVWMLTACAVPVPRLATPTPAPSASQAAPTPASTATSTVTRVPRQTATLVAAGDAGLFEKISRSSDQLHLRCDPQEIIFDVRAGSPDITQVLLLFRLKDKATGLVTSWINLPMRPAGSGLYEIILAPTALPEDARYWDAWLQYQFVGLDKNIQRLGQTQVFATEISYSPRCP